MKKIGILGGSFMPIHNGHIEMANTAYHELNLDEIWILPNGIPPYKRVTEEISVLSRLALIQAMIKSYPYMKICDYEVRKSSFQYSYETLSFFMKNILIMNCILSLVKTPSITLMNGVSQKS